MRLSGPAAEDLIYAPGADAPPADYREYGLMLQAELGEVLLRAAQCWLKPGSTGQKWMVWEILSFKREEDGDRAVLLSWERPGDHPLQVGDVVRDFVRACIAGQALTTVSGCRSSRPHHSNKSTSQRTGNRVSTRAE